MTGEVTLRGRALEIGGSRSSQPAAYRAGLREVIFPRQTKRISATSPTRCAPTWRSPSSPTWMMSSASRSCRASGVATETLSALFADHPPPRTGASRWQHRRRPHRRRPHRRRPHRRRPHPPAARAERAELPPTSVPPVLALQTPGWSSPFRSPSAPSPWRVLRHGRRGDAFRPRRARFGFQGAIPKNQPRLAPASVARWRERLTPHDLMEEIARSGFRNALERQLATLFTDGLDHDTGALAGIIPADSLPAVEHALHEFLTRFVNDLPFRERMVARLVLTDRTVEKIVEALERPIGRRRDGSRPIPRSGWLVHCRRPFGPGSSSRSRPWSSAFTFRRWSSARCWRWARSASKSSSAV